MSVETAFARLTESTAHAAEVRSVMLVNLLRREGVLEWVTNYTGDPSPVRVAEAAEVAGFELDDIDSALLALAVGPNRESVMAPTAPLRAERWLEGGITPILRWQQMSAAQRDEVTLELVQHPEIQGFRERYLGPVDPVRILEATRSAGIELLTDEAVLTLSVLMGWNP
jgi:hypothetical protein